MLSAEPAPTRAHATSLDFGPPRSGPLRPRKMLPARLAPLRRLPRGPPFFPKDQGWLSEGAELVLGRAVLCAAAAAASKVLLVESPAKAKKIQQFLGDEYKVLASYGHVRDLVNKAGSVVPEEGFSMQWSLGAHAGERVQAIAAAVQGAGQLILATDPDREGEAISWHLAEELRARKVLPEGLPCERITFTEVTRAAIEEALASPRELSQPLIDAYMARRALDYLFGFHISPVLWRKIPVGAKSAGRVQSAALRMLCQREAAIEAFRSVPYFSVGAKVALPGGEEVEARLTSADGAPPPKPGFPDAETAAGIARRVLDSRWAVAEVARREVSRSPPPPFTTSSLQQEANRRLGFSASRTMQAAQELYEEGHITYMRTDGVTLAQSAVEALRAFLKDEYGADYIPNKPWQYKSRAKNAQEAHEAIRPTNIRHSPADLAASCSLSPMAAKLYGLIHARTMACQAAPAKLVQVSVEFANADRSLTLRSSATTVAFPGFLALYTSYGSPLALAAEAEGAGEGEEGSIGRGLETQAGREGEQEGEEDLLEGVGAGGTGSQAAAAAAAATAEALGRLRRGDPVGIGGAASTAHETRPPGRFTEGSLVRALEEAGIGRPSTYASTIRLLQARKYVRREGRSLRPEPLGRVLSSFLEAYFDTYVDYGFTARMEQQLDEVAGGRAAWKEVLSDFWGPFQQCTASLSDVAVRDVIDRLDATLGEHLFAAQQQAPVAPGAPSPRACPSCSTGRLGLKLSGKTGAFIGCSNYPSCTFVRPLTAATGGGGEGDDEEGSDEEGGEGVGGEGEPSGRNAELKASKALAEQLGVKGNARHLGVDPATGMHVLVRSGLYGPYIQLGLDDQPSMKRVPLNKQVTVRSVNLQKALALLCLPRDLGAHPDSGEIVTVTSGKFGPFLKCGKVARSVPAEAEAAAKAEEAAAAAKENERWPRRKSAGETKKGAKKAGAAAMSSNQAAPAAAEVLPEVAPAHAAAAGAAAGPSSAAESVAAAAPAAASKRGKARAPAQGVQQQQPVAEPAGAARGGAGGSRAREACEGEEGGEEGEDKEEGYTILKRRSGFQFFLSDHMAKYMDVPHTKRTRLLGAQWKGLSEAERAPYNQRSEEDRERAEMQRAGYMPRRVDWDRLWVGERAHWLEGWKEWQEQMARETVRRPSSGYNLFVREFAERAKEDPSGNKHSLESMAEAWRNLPAEEKALYLQRSAEDRKRYQRERAQYIRSKRRIAQQAQEAGAGAQF